MLLHTKLLLLEHVCTGAKAEREFFQGLEGSEDPACGNRGAAAMSPCVWGTGSATRSKRWRRILCPSPALASSQRGKDTLFPQGLG